MVKLKAEFQGRLIRAGLTPVGQGETTIVVEPFVHRGPCACSCCQAYYNSKPGDYGEFTFFRYYESKEKFSASRAAELAQKYGLDVG